ncbi:hypothetical protein PF005_g12483 [Phytophthora fragariae]|uniref:EF-hand domain-containing protein n=2 Tax=Phytophthora TaxID=4783 RepID=A0A6A3YZB6_9STRA|nr:hypothetical protein PF003_g20532 [Phytophthora fragariae]KAE9027465.1 hypothetical protein PR001_g11965 [Phytophthora rubi]KAE8936368.1 hypothetical protein PF009_g13710 [Phytophthora fragariae]KAE9006694.1 hypothetical protein PF011_g11460 [Phytophthora fragariae]KAE9032201.1 hypothetical protein PR002_g9298 [Phytophthora rubi]
MQSDREQVAFLRKCFAWADRRASGVLEAHDLKCGVAAALGVRPSKLLLTQMFRSCEVPGHQLRVTQDEFVRVMQSRMAKSDLLEDIRRLFKALDLRAEGFISLRSFQQACEIALPFTKHETLLRAFREADRDGDGRVTYQDFERMCLLAVQIDARNFK